MFRDSNTIMHGIMRGCVMLSHAVYGTICGVTAIMVSTVVDVVSAAIASDVNIKVMYTSVYYNIILV